MELPSLRARVAVSGSRRWRGVLRPVLAGLVIDLIDLMTAGPIGMYGGFLLGAVAGWWFGSVNGFGRQGRLWLAVGCAIYTWMPMTEFIPLGAIVGALARVREEPQGGETNSP